MLPAGGRLRQRGGAKASGHLGKLMAAELLVCEQRGRHRYYKLADDEVVHALEVTPHGRKHLAGLLPSVNGI